MVLKALYSEGDLAMYLIHTIDRTPRKGRRIWGFGLCHFYRPLIESQERVGDLGRITLIGGPQCETKERVRV